MEAGVDQTTGWIEDRYRPTGEFDRVRRPEHRFRSRGHAEASDGEPAVEVDLETLGRGQGGAGIRGYC